MSSSSSGSEESLAAARSQPLASRGCFEADEEEDSDTSFLPPFNRRLSDAQHKEPSERSTALEALPLLPRPSIHLNHAKSGLPLATARRTSIYGSEGGSFDGDEDGEQPVRVQSGVKKVEAITMLWIRKSLTIAYVRYSVASSTLAYRSIFLIAMVTSLDSNTTQVLVPYATSSFNTHSLLSVIGIVSGVMIAVVKAPMAKIGDVFGRMEAFLLSVLLYVVGYIQMAASTNVETYAVCCQICSSTNITERRHILCCGPYGTTDHAANRDS